MTDPIQHHPEHNKGSVAAGDHASLRGHSSILGIRMNSPFPGFTFIRTAASTGAFNLNIGTAGAVAQLATDEQAEAMFDGSAWMLLSKGTLP